MGLDTLICPDPIQPFVAGFLSMAAVVLLIAGALYVLHYHFDRSHKP